MERTSNICSLESMNILTLNRVFNRTLVCTQCVGRWWCTWGGVLGVRYIIEDGLGFMCKHLCPVPNREEASHLFIGQLLLSYLLCSIAVIQCSVTYVHYRFYKISMPSCHLCENVMTNITWSHVPFKVGRECKTKNMAMTENCPKLAKCTCNVLQNHWECTLTNLLLEYQLSAGQGTWVQYSTATMERGISLKFWNFFFKELGRNI